MQVLLVEDESSIADAVIYALETERISCGWVQTGSDALETIKTTQPDLVLLDIGLPDITGFEVCKEIRTFSQVKIAFLTSRTSEIDQVLGLEFGADDYIEKPFSPRVLAARVKAHLRRNEQHTTLSQQQDEGQKNFIHDVHAKRIILDGTHLKLSRYEYGILALLLKNPLRIFSREQILSQVWEHPESSYDRTVDAHMKSLRKKIKDVLPGFDPIKTRRGLGYCYEEDPS